jgi:protein tyrosine phosphatase (PTP) superfamily phosphohydrolase (DUF442 family)
MRLPFPRSRRSRILLAVVALLVLGGLAAIWADRHLPYYHFRTVQAGAFYRSGQPTGPELERVIDRYGIRTVVNLRDEAARAGSDWWEQEHAAAARKGVRHMDVPCAGGEPPTPEQVAELLAVWDDPANRPILVHCRQGSVRSAAAEGLWRIEYMGESGPEAFAHADRWWAHLEDRYPKIAEWIRTYVPRRDRKPAGAVRPAEAGQPGEPGMATPGR